MTNASSTYGFEVPISSQIPANGQIVITFPSTSDFGLCCVATSSVTMKMLNDMNKDINGPGTGAYRHQSDCQKRPIQNYNLDFGHRHQKRKQRCPRFLKIRLDRHQKPSVAKGADTSGYSLDIKTKSSDGLTVLESGFSVNPVYIGGGSLGGTATIHRSRQDCQRLRRHQRSGLGVNVIFNRPCWDLCPGLFPLQAEAIILSPNLPTNNDYFIFTESFIASSV